MKDEARAQLREMIEDHFGRDLPRNVGLIGLIGGLATLSSAFAEVQGTGGNWAVIREALKRGIVDTQAAMKHAHDDKGLERIRDFAERQVAFAAILRDDIETMLSGDSTVA